MRTVKELMEESSPTLASSPGSLAEISELCAEMVALEAIIASKEEDLKEFKARHSLLNEKTIPEKLGESGLSEIKLEDGTSVAISNFYAASIKEENEPAAFEWLRGQGLGSIIKKSLVLKFDAEAEEEFNQAKETLEDAGLGFTEDSSVQASTLKALVKERYEAPTEEALEKPPGHIFTIFLGKKTKVKLPKK